MTDRDSKKLSPEACCGGMANPNKIVVSFARQSMERP